MKTTVELLEKHPKVSDYKINIHQKETCELFFVKGKLETVRSTDTCDKQVTVYVDHDGCKGDSQFFIYPSTTAEQVADLIDDAVEKALLIHNQDYSLPGAESGEFAVESNFRDYAASDLAALISKTVFDANTVENGSLNSVEVFINKHTETVRNSRGLHKTQVRYDAMVEAIPTYNGEKMSVELYEQYNFSSLDLNVLSAEIAGKMEEVKARFEAVTPDMPISCDVVLNKLELAQLFGSIAQNLNYSAVYSHSNLWNKNDLIQKQITGDPISITMAGEVPGSVRSAKFDDDGMSLGSIRIVEAGKAVNYYGANRFGQYLKEVPTGNLGCICVEPGTAGIPTGAYLEVVSMSGLQVDFFSDYIGGEIRLAYYHDGTKTVPVTGVSVSGKASEVLGAIRLSGKTAIHNGYVGPEKAVLSTMKIF